MQLPSHFAGRRGMEFPPRCVMAGPTPRGHAPYQGGCQRERLLAWRRRKWLCPTVLQWEVPMPRTPRTWPILAVLAVAGFAASPGTARADDIADAEREITPAKAREAIDILAGPEMKGRRVGT